MKNINELNDDQLHYVFWISEKDEEISDSEISIELYGNQRTRTNLSLDVEGNLMFVRVGPDRSDDWHQSVQIDPEFSKMVFESFKEVALISQEKSNV